MLSSQSREFNKILRRQVFSGCSYKIYGVFSQNLFLGKLIFAKMLKKFAFFLKKGNPSLSLNPSGV